jgi:uncharacterized protein (DUF952 family)
MIFHISTPEQWAIWAEQEQYESATFKEEGFIHLCTEAQIEGVLTRYYSHIEDILLIYVDESALTAPLRWEAAVEGGELFPHLYGPLNKSAIQGVESLSRAAEPPLDHEDAAE